MRAPVTPATLAHSLMLKFDLMPFAAPWCVR